jgi:hypothetical protein
MVLIKKEMIRIMEVRNSPQIRILIKIKRNINQRRKLKNKPETSNSWINKHKRKRKCNYRIKV